MPTLLSNSHDFDNAAITAIYRSESRRALATLIRLLGDFDLAEEALHDAFMAALQQWPREGIPTNPRAWLISTGRFKAIDQLRKRARFDRSIAALAQSFETEEPVASELDEHVIDDDQLRLIFICCHPGLSAEAQVALTLREICGLTTEEIAQAFLVSPSTIAQRIVRAKNKIRSANIPYEIPERAEISQRLDVVLQVIYLVFNEGYYASSGTSLIREHLVEEAIRLARLLVKLCEERLTPDAEVIGLLALMLLHASRGAARMNAQGDVILLDAQDRNLWNRDYIREGVALVTQALNLHDLGAYTLQAAIAAVHAEADSTEQTDWAEIIGLYDLLLRATPSPVIELNRAVAVAMRDGPAHGLALIDELFGQKQLIDYRLAHAARADLLRRLDRYEEACMAYRRALSLAPQEAERRFYEQRITELTP